MKLNTTIRTTTFALIIAAVSLVGTAHGAPIAGVDFEGGSGGFSIAPDDLNLLDPITVSGWTQGTGGGNPGVVNDGGANGDTAYEGTYVGRIEGSTTPNFFTITIPGSVKLNLESVSFAYRGATGGYSSREIILAAAVGAGSPISLYDVDNSGNTLPGRDATPNWVGARTPDITISNSAFQNLTDTTVRFDWWTAGGGIDIDAIVINGTIVPEPSTMVLAGLGLAGVCLRRRRR